MPKSRAHMMPGSFYDRPPAGELMAEDETSRELLERLAERLDHLERVLQANTARLHAVERQLGLEAPTPRETQAGARQRRPLYESLTDEREASKTTPPAPPVEARPSPPDEAQAPPFTQRAGGEQWRQAREA